LLFVRFVNVIFVYVFRVLGGISALLRWWWWLLLGGGGGGVGGGGVGVGGGVSDGGVSGGGVGVGGGGKGKERELNRSCRMSQHFDDSSIYF
jgi:hypothetical protein